MDLVGIAGCDQMADEQLGAAGPDIGWWAFDNGSWLVDWVVASLEVVDLGAASPSRSCRFAGGNCLMVHLDDKHILITYGWMKIDREYFDTH